MSYIGILLAAGRGSRFDPTGSSNKLLQPLADGTPVVAASAKNLLAALADVLAVVRPGEEAIAHQLRQLGCRITVCPNADEGMAASLVHALMQAQEAQGWVIALGDMPYVQPSTMRALIAGLSQGAQIAAPVCQGRRGNPVAFARSLLPELLKLRGDEGARRLLKGFPVLEVSTDDAGIWRDIDTTDDLDA